MPVDVGYYKARPSDVSQAAKREKKSLLKQNFLINFGRLIFFGYMGSLD